jgi:hypothetical protein
MLGIFFVGGTLAEAIAFTWQPIGAGNSVGNFSLAASVAAACLMAQSSRTTKMAAALALGADVVLVALKDIHGPAAVLGIILALALGGGDSRASRAGA